MYNTSLQQTVLTQHQSKAVRMVDQYWHHLAARGGIPQRKDVDPAAIQDALEYAFVAEHLSGGHTRLRVAGGSISSVIGMEVAGMPLAVLIQPEDRKVFTQHVSDVLNTPALLSVSLTTPEAFGQPKLEAKLRLYPLRDATGRTQQVLGSFVSSGAIGRTPRRFAIADAEQTPVSHLTALHSVPLATRDHLRLVVSNA